MKSIARAALAATFALAAAFGVAAQTATQSTTPKTSEITVEQAYLQGAIEALIIDEQARASEVDPWKNRETKRMALAYIKQAIDGGRKSESIRNSLEFLALETTRVIVRSGGVGKPTNNYPDIRAAACDYLAQFPSTRTKDALVKVVLSDDEPMVLSAAIRSLGKLGINEGDEVTQDIAFIVNRYDILFPDNSLAFEALIAFERIADKNKGIKDPAAYTAIRRIAGGNYISPVKSRASTLMEKLLKYQAESGK